MKYKKIWVAALVLLLGASAASAWAHGSRARVGVYIGGPVWGPVWYPPPFHYPPQVIVVPPPAPPPVYIEQSAPVPASPQYWYYCASAQGYYPYVKVCPENWQKVLPQPEQ
jgi:hypothetical protein